MDRDDASAFNDVIQVIVGEKLSSVTFVMDYWQLDFDGHDITILSCMEVSGPDWCVGVEDERFRNRLCERIALKVTRAGIMPDDMLVIGFEDGSAIEISLRDEDYRGPEAMIFTTYSRPNDQIIL